MSEGGAGRRDSGEMHDIIVADGGGEEEGGGGMG